MRARHRLGFGIAAAALAAACSNPPLTLRLRITDGDSQQCYSDDGEVTTSCEDVTMLCPAYVSIRIAPPNDPTAPYISMCRSLDTGTGARLPTLCSLATPDLELPAMPVVEQTLEVQVAVFREGDIMPDPLTGLPVCPRVEYSASGLPVAVLPRCEDPDPFACPRVPAVGGRAFYNPGDEKTVVELGCTNLEDLTNSAVCTGVERLSVTATVNDFDNPVSSVDRTVADRLTVGVGEPLPLGDTFVLDPGDSEELDRTMSTPPSWAAMLTDIGLDNYACLEVLENAAQTTTALTCRNDINGDDEIDLPGYFLKRATLEQILSALGMSSFPDEGGLVVGMVVDENFNPRAGETVACGGCNVQYVNGTRTGTVVGTTSQSGIFVLTDAPFGTEFSLSTSISDTVPPSIVGGIVEGKVTIVVLQRKSPIIEDP